MPTPTDEENEVWFTNDRNLTLHGHIIVSLRSSAPGGPRRYVVRDDYDVMHVTDEEHMERPTSRAILTAERDIRSVMHTLSEHHDLPWTEHCARRLGEALYELAKPEATDRRV